MTDERVESVPEGVPMSFKCSLSSYYVRDCYLVFYDHIKALLATRKDYVSVAGTPGVGKSIFFLFVFNMYRKENPDKTIVTASFSKNQELKQCVVFYPDGTCRQCVHDNQGWYVPRRTERGAIHLYDGPPEFCPSNSQMIAFTRNASWLKSMRKDATHISLWMPPWTFEELSDANDLLKLHIANDILRQNYEKFGGVARYCLSTKQVFVAEGLWRLDAALEKIQSYGDFEACICGNEGFKAIAHRLFYDEPAKEETFPYFNFATMRFGSRWIAAKVYERIQNKTDGERAKWINFFDGSRYNAAIRGSLFEQYAHAVFLKGGKFCLFSMLDAEMTSETTKILILPNHWPHKKVTASLPLEGTFEDIYMMPIAENFEALDSFYYSKSNKMIYVFQITMFPTHDVSAPGLTTLLKLTSLEDAIYGGSIQMVLVFVIPKCRGKFTKQSIVTPGIPRMDELKDTPIEKVKGVGAILANQLGASGINNCEELYAAVERKAEAISCMKDSGEAFVKMIKDRSFFESVPQFFVKLDLDR